MAILAPDCTTSVEHLCEGILTAARQLMNSIGRLGVLLLGLSPLAVGWEGEGLRMDGVVVAGVKAIVNWGSVRAQVGHYWQSGATVRLLLRLLESAK